MAKTSLIISKEEEEAIRELPDLTKQQINLLLRELDLTRAKLDDYKKVNKKLNEAYLRIREKVGAWDTPTAPTAEQIYLLTESKIDHLLKQFACAQCIKECEDRGHLPSKP